MDRGTRFLFILLLGAGLYFLMGGFGSSERAFQPIGSRTYSVPEARGPSATCDLWTEEVHAVVAAQGGVLTSVKPLSDKYQKDKKQIELVTTPAHPELSPLYVGLAGLPGKTPPAPPLAATDILDFTIAESSPTKCVLVHRSERLFVEKTFTVGASPYAVNLHLSVRNESAAPGAYTLDVATSTFLEDHVVESKMFQMNPLMTHVECVGDGGEAKRLNADAFEPDAFEDKALFPAFELSAGDWAKPAGQASLAAVSNAYFTNAIAHDVGPQKPECLLQIEERWDSVKYGKKSADPHSAAIYKARLAYQPRILAPGATDEYDYHAFVGPKERHALSAAGARFEPLIDLGFFSVIAKVLVGFLLWVHGYIPSWGVAIVLLTITARTLLFPLTWPSIKNMVHMRELKPEMDRITEKYKDDAQARGLAQMELWKKHGVNPMKGCLPQLASMPVWFALYTTLQTAVELYNIPFLWFPDLSRPDPLYILPLVIGGTFFLQQKLMPMQGGDPAQQKMMMYFMPVMFTVFMLFLPAGLGVYMFTNSLLGIGQQQLVELHAKRTLSERRARMGDSELVEKPASRGPASTSKGRARA